MSLNFGTGKPEDLDEIWDFLLKNFFPDEPVSRSCLLPSLNNPESALFIKDLMINAFVSRCLAKETSVVVRNEANEIVGVMLSVMQARGQVKEEPTPDMSKLSKKVVWCFEFLEFTDYDPNKQFEKRPDCSKMAFGDILCVHQSARGKALGRKMLDKNMAMMKALGCEYYFVSLSGIYSQAIFTKADFELVGKFVYDDFRDDEGNVVVDKQGEHKHCQTMIKKL